MQTPGDTDWESRPHALEADAERLDRRSAVRQTGGCLPSFLPQASIVTARRAINVARGRVFATTSTSIVCRCSRNRRAVVGEGTTANVAGRESGRWQRDVAQQGGRRIRRGGGKAAKLYILSTSGGSSEPPVTLPPAPREATSGCEKGNPRARIRENGDAHRGFPRRITILLLHGRRSCGFLRRSFPRTLQDFDGGGGRAER
ncbi:hypothetical protein MRX96_021094 [Rhipicephalus microplus]